MRVCDGADVDAVLTGGIAGMDLAQAKSRIALLEEQLRIREESQIPVIPHAAQEKMERLERQERARTERLELAEAVVVAASRLVDLYDQPIGAYVASGGEPYERWMALRRALREFETRYWRGWPTVLGPTRGVADELTKSVRTNTEKNS